MENNRKQFASDLLMVRPAAFGANKETLLDNAFQKESPLPEQQISSQAMKEFDFFAGQLRKAGVNVHVVADQLGAQAPDAVFPNNWLSTHEDGKVCLYPMKAVNRRLEKLNPALDNLKEQFKVKETIDLSHHAENKRFLEGTGSIIFDHKNRLAFAALSERTDKDLFEKHCALLGYSPILFQAVDNKGESVYHTNVMFAMARDFAIVCFDMIPSKKEKEMVAKTLRDCGKQIIQTTYDQTLNFCCNVLQAQGAKLSLAMSEQAWNAFNPEQKELIQDSSTPIHAPLYTIEECGGGGARCMLAEIYLDPL